MNLVAAEKRDVSYSPNSSGRFDGRRPDRVRPVTLACMKHKRPIAFHERSHPRVGPVPTKTLSRHDLGSDIEAFGQADQIGQLRLRGEVIAIATLFDCAQSSEGQHAYVVSILNREIVRTRRRFEHERPNRRSFLRARRASVLATNGSRTWHSKSALSQEGETVRVRM